MIKLLTYKEAFGQFSASPFCVKAAWLLNMAGEAWERKDLNDPRKMPNQKLPAIKVGERLIPDSDNIRAYLEEQGTDFEPGLSDSEKSTARAFIRMAEEHLYFHQVMDRWGNDKNWEIIREIFFTEIPKPLRNFISGGIRKGALKGLHQQGVSRLSEEDRLARVEHDLVAISTRLTHHPFLFGDRPTAADASVAAVIAGIAAAPTPTMLSQRVGADAILFDYANRAAKEMGNGWVSAGSA
jgi:glutathione S-transferase